MGRFMFLDRRIAVRRTTPEEGGETVFPLAANRVSGPQWSECAKGGAAVKARRGDALLFYRCACAAARMQRWLYGPPPAMARVKAGMNREHTGTMTSNCTSVRLGSQPCSLNCSGPPLMWGARGG